MSSTLLKSLRLLFVPALILCVTLLALACGGDDGGDGGGGQTPAARETPTEEETPATAETPTAGEPIAFDVSMGDNFFQPNDITVSPGQEVTFNLTNNGAAIHNMRVDGGDGQYQTPDDTVSDPALVNAGETAVLTWTAPDTSGAINFQCDFHTTDMTGAITVE